MTDADARRLIVADLTARLRPVCTEWPPELFGAMIEHLADITLKYDRGHATPVYDRRSTDRLVADLKSALERSKSTRDSGTTNASTERKSDPAGEPQMD